MSSWPVSPLLASDAADEAGWPPDLPGGRLVAIRVADLEQQLDEMTGPHDTIGQVAAQVSWPGRSRAPAGGP